MSKMVWRGKMACDSCGYNWQSRRNSPPARCANCWDTDITPVMEAKGCGCITMIILIIGISVGFSIIASMIGTAERRTDKETPTYTRQPQPIQKHEEPPPHDDLTHFIARFGHPDREISTEYDNPRPPIVTRFLIYEKENLRVVYRADIPVGSVSPIKNWKFVGFQNEMTDNVITPSEAIRMMSHRDRK